MLFDQTFVPDAILEEDPGDMPVGLADVDFGSFLSVVDAYLCCGPAARDEDVVKPGDASCKRMVIGVTKVQTRPSLFRKLQDMPAAFQVKSWRAPLAGHHPRLFLGQVYTLCHCCYINTAGFSWEEEVQISLHLHI
ncbi:hypothetical protein L1049_012776 [Liquidambar formosana]|uniref:Uncharacterized protein n=1 Tax=Liquidambar formosana TaxID=63359 RepID=A0AAP0WWG3_LIQFO